ncbi:MAG: hypothetical protein R3300_03780 [Candidatus Promineifilaceae bacterium]|nr:hypothetical protein [Candidatus Promineifilaceae bacterium]
MTTLRKEASQLDERPTVIGLSALACLLFAGLWLGLFIYGLATAVTVDQFATARAYAARLDAPFYLTYANAALVTITATLFMGALYSDMARRAPLWAAMAVLFVPAYTVLALFAYLSQITIVPALLEPQAGPAAQAAADVILAQLLQVLPGSAVAMLNNLAYALLGVPSLIFGLLLWQQKRATSMRRWGGMFLALSGAASIVGFIGLMLEAGWLSWGSIVGGVLFLAALAAIGLSFLRHSEVHA